MTSPCLHQEPGQELSLADLETCHINRRSNWPNAPALYGYLHVSFTSFMRSRECPLGIDDQGESQSYLSVDRVLIYQSYGRAQLIYESSAPLSIIF